MVQLAGVNQVQAFVPNALEARQDFVDGRLHHALASLVSGEVEVQVLTHKTIRHAGEAVKRILDAVAKELAPEQIVINRHAEREFH